MNTGLPAQPLDVRALTLVGNTIFAALAANGVYYTTNDGVSWTAANNGLPTTKNVNAIEINGSTLFALGQDIYISNDNGNSWTVDTIGLSKKYIRNVFSVGNSVYAGTNGDGVYTQTGAGSNWSNWSAFKNGLPALADVRDLNIDGNLLFAGIFGGSVWKALITDIKQISTEVPGNYSLSQNYPNPFNPSTNINFKIKETKFVKLSVYNFGLGLVCLPDHILGAEVASLVNQKLTPGNYKVTFDGSSLSSGIYFYRLTTDNFNEVKKMTLIK